MRCAILVLAGLVLTGCTDEGIRTGLIGGRSATAAAAATFTTADVRAIVRRQVRGRTIICTEPLPDVARAFARSGQLSASGGNGAATGTLAASAASSQAVAELAGRSTALLGVRDGLYRACEAYANGIIGDDAYALVLSRYSQLMVTLFLGQDLASAETRSAPVVAVTGGPAAASSPLPKPPEKPAAQPSSYRPDDSPALLRIGLLTVSTRAAPAGDRQAPRNRGAASTAPAATSGPTSAAAAIADMQRTYLGLDNASNATLLVACIEENDPTRAALQQDGSGRAPAHNTFLQPICDQIRLSSIARIAAAIRAGPGP